MATPPTRVAAASSPYNSATSPKTASPFTLLAGDQVVAGIIKSNNQASENYLTSLTSNDPVFTENPPTVVAIGADDWQQTVMGTAVGASPTGEVVSSSRISGDASAFWGFTALQYRNSAGFGTVERSATGTGTNPGAAAISFDVTTQFDNSALVVFISDWSAVDATTRTWRTINGYTPSAGNGGEVLYFRDSAHYTLAVLEYPDAGVAGLKTIGLTTPVGGDWVFAVVEVRGSAGPPVTMYQSAMREMTAVRGRN